MPLLKCLRLEQARYTLDEVHEGICGEHLGARALAAKVLRAEFYWPTMLMDATDKIWRCDKCQRYGPIMIAHVTSLQGTFQPTPIAQWGMDILGPFPIATRQRKFLLVTIDYFTKWIGDLRGGGVGRGRARGKVLQGGGSASGKGAGKRERGARKRERGRKGAKRERLEQEEEGKK